MTALASLMSRTTVRRVAVVITDQAISLASRGREAGAIRVPA